MTFTSLEFLFFFPVVVLLYYSLPRTLRIPLLFVASCYFYMAFVPEYILILFFIIAVDFFSAQKIEAADQKNKKVFFILSLIANIGILFVFKYFNFFNENIALIAEALNWNYSIKSLELLLPIGLSFHVFQSISYVFEVYRKNIPAEKNLLTYATYVLFFPQMVAGPIERPQHLLVQLRHTVTLKLKNITTGLRLMGWGFFKKVVLADHIAIVVDHVYRSPEKAIGPTLFLVMILFAIQLYADFSGYSDIARGAARVLGIDIMQNFNRPYISKSIAEFWRRWHISLSTWFRDYFYYPLVYSKKQVTRAWLYCCIMITFLVTGLWHGAGWTYIILGGIHGAAIALAIACAPFWKKIFAIPSIRPFLPVSTFLQAPVTFLIVSFSWIFFRSPNMPVAIAYVQGLFSGWMRPLSEYAYLFILHPMETLGIDAGDVRLIIGALAILWTVEWIQGKISIDTFMQKRSVFFQTFAYSSLVIAIMLFGVYSTKQFIYFQF